MRPHVIRLASAALVALAVAGAAPLAVAAPQLVRTLPSKTTVIVRENRARPAVAIQVWVRVGTRDEGRSERGAAAVLAQLPWEGNAKRSKDEIDQVAGMVGGRYSGEASNGAILYEMDLPARSFKQGLETLADVVLHPSFEGKAVENAKSLARTASRNALGHAALASMNPLRDALHPSNALGAPASVPELEIAALNPTLVSRFHKAWFTGENILVVIAGDVDPEEAAAAVAEAFATVSTSKSPGRSRGSERPLSGTKVLGLTNPDGTGGAATTIGFRAPAWGSADALALDALIALLTDYSDARLQRRIGDASYLQGASAQRSFEADGGTVAISMVAAPENLIDADAILLGEIERARFTPIDDAEFRHTIEAMIARDLVVQSDLAGVGRVTAYGAMQVRPGSDEVYTARLRALKKEDLVAVARQYLDPKQAVIVHMAPKNYVDSLDLYKNLEANVLEKVTVAAATYRSGGGPQAAVTTPDERRRRVDAPLASIPAAPRDAGRGRVSRTTIEGLRVLASEDRGAEIATIAVFLEGSVRHETAKNNGITRLLRETLLTSSDPAAEGRSYRFSMADIGRFVPYQDRDMWGYSITVPASRWKEAVSRLGAMLSKPELDSITVDATRLLVLDQQTQWLENEEARRRQLIYETKYETSGYRLPLVGSRMSIIDLSLDEVAAFYRKLVVKPNVVVAVFGDVKADEVGPVVAEAFRSIAPGPFSPGPLPQEQPFENFREKWELGEGPHCTVSIAFDGPPASSPLVPTGYVVNSLFINPRGWFKKYIREKTPYARDVQSYVAHSIDEAPIVATITAENTVAEETTVKMLFGQFRSLAAIRLINDYAPDLEDAKRHAVGNFQMGLASNQGRAFQFARAELFKLPADYVIAFPAKMQAVTADDMQRYAFQYFQYPDAGRRPYAVSETRPGGW